MKLKITSSLIISLLIFTFAIVVHAASSVTVYFNKGTLVFYTTDTAANTGTKYVTTGWIITKNKRNGNPTVGGDYGEIDNMPQTSEYPDPPIPGQPVTTKFEVPETAVNKAMIQAGLGSTADGGTVYLSSIFQVSINGRLQPTKYYSKSAIENAEPWSDMSGFDQYYDIVAPFSSDQYPVNVIYQTQDGTNLNYTPKLLGNYTSGKTVSDTLDKTYTYNGTTYTLVESYISPIADTTQQNFVEDASVTTRNIIQQVGGTDIVAIYKKLNAPLITLTANPTSLQTGQSSTLTATPQNMPSTDHVVIIDQNSKNTLSGQNQVQATTATATDSNAETVSYIAEIVDGTGSIVMTSNSVQVTWSTSGGSGGGSVQPSITLSANPTQLTVGQSSTLTATAQNVPQGDSVAINDINLHNTLSGQNQVQGTTATATSSSAITGIYQAVILDSTGNIAYQSNQVQVIWQKPTNVPPVAKIYVQSPVKVGDDVTLDGGNSYDPDQPNDPNKGIGSYHWTVTGPGKFSGSATGETSTGQFDTAGTYTINLTVYDTDAGDPGTASTTIQVLPPSPTAIDNIGGTEKQNRLVTIDASESTSPKDYPIDWTKTHWTITAISGGTATDIKYSGSLDPNKSNDILFKQPGQYQISVTVTNSLGLSDTNTQTITIAPDEAPDAEEYSPSHTVLRDPNDNDWGTHIVYDCSKSRDQDYIAKRVWYITWDANNNGTFSDDPTLTIDDSTLTLGVWKDITFNGNNYMAEETIVNGYHVLYFKSKLVGNYNFDLQVTEGFGQPTLSQFISPSDYKTDNTFNKPPLSSLPN